jgi:hypothetical protein
MEIQVDCIGEGDKAFYNFPNNSGVVTDGGEDYYEGGKRKPQIITNREKILLPMNKVSIDFVGFMYETMKEYEDTKGEAIIVVRKKEEYDEIGFAIF